MAAITVDKIDSIINQMQSLIEIGYTSKSPFSEIPTGVYTGEITDISLNKNDVKKSLTTKVSLNLVSDKNTKFSSAVYLSLSDTKNFKDSLENGTLVVESIEQSAELLPENPAPFMVRRTNGVPEGYWKPYNSLKVSK